MGEVCYCVRSTTVPSAGRHDLRSSHGPIRPGMPDMTQPFGRSHSFGNTMVGHAVTTYRPVLSKETSSSGGHGEFTCSSWGGHVSVIDEDIDQQAARITVLLRSPRPKPARPPDLLHDLRQPTSAILLLAAASELEVDDAAAVRRRLRQIRAEAVWLSHLIESTCDHDEPRPLELADVVADCVERVDVTSEARILATELPSAHVVAAPLRLRRALSNILCNAARAAGPDGEVHVRVEIDDQVVIHVTDDGPGFGHLPVVHGEGLGIARAAMACMGGRLEVADHPGSET